MDTRPRKNFWEQVEVADGMARASVSKPLSSVIIPYTDFKGRVRSYVDGLWHAEWSSQTENKLFQHRSQLNEPLPHVCRTKKEESVLCHLHTGHSYLTHAFLHEEEAPPKCVNCDDFLSVRHLLFDCKALATIRCKHYTVDNFKTLFRDVPSDVLFAFAREAVFFNKF